MPTLVHLIYIHGFQGNDTTFQSFPKHLQRCLESRISQHLDISIQSSLYPTYKSVKPISFATKNFLEWLSTQPPGPVILLGHSMGGLLAADAATDPSNNPDRHRPKRIVGVIAFDTPYLGMHPHVVVTGIASLFPKKGTAESSNPMNSEEAMNQHPQVNIVDEKVTEDWDAFKREANVHPKTAPYPSDSQSVRSHSTLSIASSVSTFSQASSALNLSNGSSSPSHSPNRTQYFIDRSLAFLASKEDDKFVKWLRKHSNDPFSAGKRWVVEHFQFGICMFDPAGLKSRYTRLVDWAAEGGLWINYWTTTVPRDLHDPHHDVHEAQKQEVSDTAQSSQERLENDEALLANGIISTHVDNSSQHNMPTPASPGATSATSSSGESRPNDAQNAPKQDIKRVEQEGKSAKDSGKKSKPIRHFVVLPNGLGSVLGGWDKWENVPIAGVEDEVNAHTGLFIPRQNLEYEALVERVAEKVLAWCDRIVVAPQIQGRT